MVQLYGTLAHYVPKRSRERLKLGIGDRMFLFLSMCLSLLTYSLLTMSVDVLQRVMLGPVGPVCQLNCVGMNLASLSPCLRRAAEAGDVSPSTLHSTLNFVNDATYRRTGRVQSRSRSNRRFKFRNRGNCLIRRLAYQSALHSTVHMSH
jgi:hypothetical protein